MKIAITIDIKIAMKITVFVTTPTNPSSLTTTSHSGYYGYFN